MTKQGESWLLLDQLLRDYDVSFTTNGRFFEELKFDKWPIYCKTNNENTNCITQLRKN